MDGAQVGVLKQSNKVSLAGLLKSHDGGALEPQVSLEVLGNLTNKPLEGQLTDEQFSGLLVPWGQGKSGFDLEIKQYYLLISLRATVPGL